MTLIDLGRYPITTGLCIALQEGGEIRGWIKAIRGRNQGVDQSNQRDVGLLHNLDPRGTLIIGILCDVCPVDGLSSVELCVRVQAAPPHQASVGLVYLWYFICGV